MNELITGLTYLYVRVGFVIFHLYTVYILGSAIGGWAALVGFFFPPLTELFVGGSIFQAAGLSHPYVLGLLSFPAVFLFSAVAMSGQE